METETCDTCAWVVKLADCAYCLSGKKTDLDSNCEDWRERWYDPAVMTLGETYKAWRQRNGKDL